MANSMEAKEVYSGHDGEVWLDGDYCAEVVSIKAEVSIDKEEVKMVQHMGKGYRDTGLTCKGSLKMHKISSYMINKISENIKARKQTIFTIISKIDNRNNKRGVERIMIKDATFDNLPLLDWEVDKLLEESYNFTFSDWQILDKAL